MPEQTNRAKESRISEPSFTSLQLQIVEPRFDKNFMIAFDAPTKAICHAYNAALQEVLNAEHLMPFHQVGVTSNHQHAPGYHAWEVWVETDREQLVALFPRIQTRAAELYPLFAPAYKS